MAEPAFGRLSININTATEASLLARRTELGITITEQVRRAVALLDLFDRETQAGNRIRLVGKGPDQELLLLGGGRG
ncbi:hypothetical protein [Streptacidiphilus sp. PAMC 29251]